MDWVGTLETVYGLDGSDEDYLRRVVASMPYLDRGFGVVAQAFDVADGAPRLVCVGVSGGAETLVEEVRAMSALMPPEFVTRVVRVGAETSVARALEALGLVGAFAAQLARETSGGARDVTFVAAHDAERHLIAVSSASRDVGRALPHARRLRRVLAHLGIGWRLRRRLVAAPDVEAVLSPSGALEHAVPPAARAREVLAAAVRTLERVRTRAGRAEPDAALEAWRGLVLGRWSLVDRFERDGRRYLVAHRNDPRVRDPRGLEVREAQVAAALGRGGSLKSIAYELGVSPSAVAKSAHRARAKLGLAGLGELAALFSPDGGARHTHELAVGGERFAVTSLGPAPGALAGLSSAEVEVAVRVARGETNAEIARARGTRPRTVANQVQAIFAKLGVRSRVELGRRLASPV